MKGNKPCYEDFPNKIYFKIKEIQEQKAFEKELDKYAKVAAQSE